MISRRNLLELGLLAGGAIALPIGSGARAVQAPVRGGRLIMGIGADPAMATSALTVAGSGTFFSGKIFDGLVSYDFDLNPRPQLATRWTVSPDGLTIGFALRPGVFWHDGHPFTSDDVAYSLLEVWRKYHSRGRSTFANVTDVETPDPLTVIWKLSKPAPYILSALSATESQILPKHLYAGTDVLTNPRNNAPIGTGPFRFAVWQPGSHILLERNPSYWDQPKPYLDQILIRILPDSSASAVALETGEIHLINSNYLPYGDLDRLSQLPDIELDRRGSAYAAGISSFEFNLDRPLFRDQRVRQAFAHAIDRDFIVKNIWRGYGENATGPVPPSVTRFYTRDVPAYPFDLAAAAALLDAAGLKPDAAGMRFSLTLDPAPTADTLTETAEFLRNSFGRIGIKVQIRNSDFASFVHRIYTDRDFDTIVYSATAGPDPVIGVQRFYWSKNFKPGVAFSNGSHYQSPEADRLLESAQVEIDPIRRRDLYWQFQQLVQGDLPTIPLVASQLLTLGNRRVRQHTVTGDGIAANFASTYLVAAA
jgi:peptide/nickel transport system substrate-binding protein